MPIRKLNQIPQITAASKREEGAEENM